MPKSRGIVTRSLILEVRKGKPRFSRVSHQLKTVKDTMVKILAQTPTDVNIKVPRMLEVNKSVIENVMFCHQEHSTWPFSDNATLKKIFDDLFDTKKNVKRIENLRKNSTELKGKLSKARYEVEVTQRELENKKKVLFEYSDKTKELREIKDSISLMNVKIRSLDEKWTYEKITNDKEKIYGDLGILRFQLSEKKEAQKQKKNQILAVQNYIDFVQKQDLENLILRRLMRKEGIIDKEHSDQQFLDFFQISSKAGEEHERIEKYRQILEDVGFIRKN